MNNRSSSLLIVILVFISGVAILFISHGTKDSKNVSQKIQASESISVETTRAMKDPLQAPYLPSLEVRENTHFLLTPAMLIQQSIRGDEIITYPSE